MDLKELQNQVSNWLVKCFGLEIANDKVERSYRFLEESLELFQATGRTQEEAERLAHYVFSRPTGEAPQEAGGVLLTLTALCYANDISLDVMTNMELIRVWQKMTEIREKQKSKPRLLGEVYPERHTEINVGQNVATAIALIRRFGSIGGDHHKQWVLDQVVRALTGNHYLQWVLETEEDCKYPWSEGIAP